MADTILVVLLRTALRNGARFSDGVCIECGICPTIKQHVIEATGAKLNGSPVKIQIEHVCRTSQNGRPVR